MNTGKALVLIGPRQAGKTSLLRKLASHHKQVLWLNADEMDIRERLQNQTLPALTGLVGNSKMVVIDEVQRIRNAGLLLKLLVDNFPEVQIIATGSSSLDIAETVFEPLTGRHFQYRLYPFSLSELYADKTPFEVEREIPFHLVHGTYPDVCNHRSNARLILENLSNQYLYKDVLAWKNIRKPELLDKLLKLLAYQVGSEVSMHELATTLRVKPETVESYINLLEKSFVVFRLKSLSNNPRKEVAKMSKVYFWDNGIRNAVIGTFNPPDMRSDMGALWENFMISERQKFNANIQRSVPSFFWRNYNQSEVDYVELHTDQLMAYEFKYNAKGKGRVSAAFKNAYPNAITELIQPNNFHPFLFQKP